MKKLLILLLMACSLFGQFKFQRSLDDRYTVLHIRGNGQSGSTIISDVSQYGNTVVAYNGAVISVIQSKFNGSSTYFDGTNDYLSVPSNDLFNFGTNDFTIDFWAYLSSATNYSAFLSKENGSTARSFIIGLNTGSNLEVYMSSDGSNWNIASGKRLSTGIPSAGWDHFAIVRNGSNFYTFKNGIQQDTWSSSSAIYSSAQDVKIFRCDNTGAKYYGGYLQEFRISKGIARWTSNFTPPNKPY